MTGLIVAVGIWAFLVAVWAYALCRSAAHGDRMARERDRFHDGPRHTPGGWRMSDHEGFDRARDDDNQGVGSFESPWDSPTRRSIFKTSRASRATARPGANPDGHDTAPGGRPLPAAGSVSPSSSTKE